MMDHTKHEDGEAYQLQHMKDKDDDSIGRHMREDEDESSRV